MGNILSASSVYANAYLTKQGRDYLFNQTNNRFVVNSSTGILMDLMKITHFSLSDPDMNYNIADNLRLESGDVPDISGKNDDCIKSTHSTQEKNLVSFDGDLSPASTGGGVIVVQYSTSPSDTLVININDPLLPDALL